MLGAKILFLALSPFSYTACRYYWSLTHFIKYILTEFALLTLAASHTGATWQQFIFGFFFFYALYEIGYIDNDFISKRKNGEKPRVSSILSSFMTRYDAYCLIFYRLLVFFSIVIYLLCEKFQYFNIYIYIVASTFVLFVFLLFNRASNTILRLSLFIFLAYAKIIIISSAVTTNLTNFSHMILDILAISFLYNARKIYEYSIIKFQLNRVELLALVSIPFLFLTIYYYYLDELDRFFVLLIVGALPVLLFFVGKLFAKLTQT